MSSRRASIFVLACLLGFPSAIGAWARAGEEEEAKPQPKVQMEVARPGFVGVRAAAAAPATDGGKAEAERAAIAADLVAVIKVTAIAEPQDEAKEGKEKEAVPNAVVMLGRWQAVEKTVSADVVEVLKGGGGAKSLTILAQVRKIGNQEHLMVTADRQQGNVVFRNTMSVPFTLAKDKEALVFLKLLREDKDEAGQVTGRVWSLVPPVADGAPKETVDAVRAALVKLADWEKAPELSAADAAAIDALIKQLGNDSYETREKATRELTAKGEVARGRLREAAKSTDAETRDRAARIIEAITPGYLKAQSASDPSSGIHIRQGGAGGVQVIQMQVEAGN